MVLLPVVVVLSLAYLGVIFFLARGLYSLSFPTEPERGLTFSVIIAAHNEENHIEQCVRSVMNQTIEPQRYEVIVADDRSSDATPSILQRLSREYQRLSILTIKQTPPGWSPKKWAISQAVARAKNEIVVFTDADCRVRSTWLSSIERFFDHSTGVVQGVTTMARPAGMHPLFFGLQAIDFLSHGIVSAAAIGVRLPLNSNANNFAFRREAFERLGGYGTARGVVSGDDDLLLQRFASSKRWGIRFMTDCAGAVITTPAKTISEVLEQRKRWASKTIHYNAAQVALLSTVFLFYLGIVVVFIAGFFYPSFFAAALVMILIKMCGEMVLMSKGMRLFGQTSLLPYLPLASLLQLPVVIYAVINGVAGKFRWKGRTFRRRIDSATLHSPSKNHNGKGDMCSGTY